MTDPAPLDDRYWFIEGPNAVPIDVPVDAFWTQLVTGEHTDDVVASLAKSDGWLVTAYRMDSDMDSSEMHPDGDELHYIVSGSIDLVLEEGGNIDEGGGDAIVTLVPGDMGVVPRGVWHRIIVHEPVHAVALTCGRGTRHRPLAH